MKPAIAILLSCSLLLASIYSCKKEYSYEGGPAAAGFIVKDSNGDCNLNSISGKYVIGHRLADSNSIQIEVYVTQPGHYSIASGQNNGFSFSTSGKFSDTGLVFVQLPANGIPLNTGISAFSLQFDTSVCQVSITVDDSLTNVVQTSNPDYFPLTPNSRWVYDDLSYPGDSIIHTIEADTTANGLIYAGMNEYVSFYPVDNPYYFRKAGLGYLEFAAVSLYTHSLDFAPTIYEDLPFLKEDSHTGDIWNSNTFTGRVSVGIDVMSLQYEFKCIDNNATVMINGMTFQHVIKIEERPQVASPGQNLANTGEIRTSYFAKGVGLIYREYFNGIKTHPELQIRSWTVN